MVSFKNEQKQMDKVCNSSCRYAFYLFVRGNFRSSNKNNKLLYVYLTPNSVKDDFTYACQIASIGLVQTGNTAQSNITMKNSLVITWLKISSYEISMTKAGMKQYYIKAAVLL